MGIYYFLLWIGVIGTFLSQDSRLKRTGFYIIFIYILALFVMVVFRYDVGTDYLEYTDYYYRIHSLWLCKLNCVMLYSHSISSVGERPAPRGGTTRPDERKITII